jgi:hypothetical protein
MENERKSLEGFLVQKVKPDVAIISITIEKKQRNRKEQKIKFKLIIYKNSNQAWF